MDSSCEFRQQTQSRQMRILRAAASLALMLPAAPFFAQSPSLFQPPSADLQKDQQKALNDFSHKVKQYLSMEHNLPAEKMKQTTDVAELARQRDALRQAVQKARPDAKQGEFFTPPVAAAFRSLLSQTMSGQEGAKIRISLAHAEPGASTNLKVNGVYPDGDGRPLQSVPPTLLLNLPVLPKGLEYCIAGKTLALRDTSANLVVDLLPNALP
jgi:hypothetical protein